MLENLKERRSIRKYKPEQITDAHLDAILEAGKMGIRNAMNYHSDEAGTREMWEKERKARMNFMEGTRSGVSVKRLKDGYFKEENK